MPAKQIKKKPAKHGRKREDILQGALEHISRHGLEGTGLKEIAAHLGITHPALYYYFKSKDQIVFEAVRKAMKGLIAELEESQAGLPENPELRLMALCQAHVQHELARGQEVSFVNAFIYGPLRNASSLSEEDRAEITDLQRHVLALYRERIQQGQQTGDFIDGDPTILAFGVLGLVSYSVSWYRPGGKLTIGAAARSMAVQAVRSVKARFGPEII
ncbi:TetR/AcrR family transcriptional regulator [Algihabitans albus]|uniref:TetR/AcrR family transcriptional regulator n=1 Tax=Algihabitans albus TaxID=2164067 RepID=UPI000E5D5E09|nr:TetR/AcrR family transcriptional regulator [Algihabitans albus]